MKYSDEKNITIIWLTRVIVPLVMLIANVIIYKIFHLRHNDNAQNVKFFLHFQIYYSAQR